MSAAFQNKSAGTAPHNEMEQFHKDAQRDDGEARDPETAAERLKAQLASQLPDGFYMSETYAGKPIAKPTRAYAREVLDEVRDVYENRELREDEFDSGDLHRALDKVSALLHEENEFAGNGFMYSMARSHALSFAGAVRWLNIHAMALDRHQENGNENAAENSLINFEGSKRQAFIEAAILDWCADNGAEINLQRGTDDALGLAGWQLTNQNVGQNNRKVRQTTRDLLWNGRQEKEAASPDEKLEASEEELDDAMAG